MQRSENADDSPILDTKKFLRSQGIDYEHDPSRVTRSISSSSYGRGASLLGLGGGLGYGKPETVYRSVEVQSPFISPASFARPSYGKHSEYTRRAHYHAPGKASDLFAEKLKLTSSGQRDRDLVPVFSVKAPPLSTRPQPPLLGARMFDVDGDYQRVLSRIEDFMVQEGVFDEKVEKEAACAEGAWYCERHFQEISFAIKVYERTESTDSSASNNHAVEVVKRSGCGFAFNDFMERAQRVIAQGALPSLMPPQLTGELGGFGDLDSLDIDIGLLEEWVDIIGNERSPNEVRRHELQVIAKAAAQSDCAKMWEGRAGAAFIACLIDVFVGSGDACMCRHGRKAIQRLREAGLALAADTRDAVGQKERQLDQRN